MAKLGQFHDKQEELFDPWEHLYENEEEFQPIKTKVKKMKKEKPFSDKKRK